MIFNASDKIINFIILSLPPVASSTGTIPKCMRFPVSALYLRCTTSVYSVELCECDGVHFINKDNDVHTYTP